jgi:hypothetical protein
VSAENITGNIGDVTSAEKVTYITDSVKAVILAAEDTVRRRQDELMAMEFAGDDDLHAAILLSYQGALSEFRDAKEDIERLWNEVDGKGYALYWGKLDDLDKARKMLSNVKELDEEIEQIKTKHGNNVVALNEKLEQKIRDRREALTIDDRVDKKKVERDAVDEKRVIVYNHLKNKDGKK